MSQAIIQSELLQEIVSEEAFKRVLHELEALPADQVGQVNLEVTGAAATAIGARQEFLPLRSRLETELPKFNASNLDKVVDYAYALLYAQSLYQTATQPADGLPETADQATTMRDTLYADASALARRGLIPPDSLKEYGGRSGYKNVADDLQLLVSALKAYWPAIEGKCAAQKDELDLASRLAGRIVRLVGLREQSPAAVAEVADKRARAFTLFVTCYDEIRRAVTYLRHHEGDADEIAPSLYAGRNQHRPDQPAQPATPPVAPTPAQPNAGTTPVIRTQGLPGGNPFMD